MKIGERIKKVLEMNPEIQKRRTQLRAMAYLEKRNPKKYRTSISTQEPISVYLHEKLFEGGQITVASLHALKPLSAYPATVGEKMITDALRDTGGIVMKGLEKVWNEINGKTNTA